jgi:putative hydrolase of the HAD superfamily
VPPLLDTLQRSGIPFGIVTNGSRRQLRTVHALGLDTLADCVLVSGVFGCRKPDAPIFTAAALRLGVAPAEILFAGDNPVDDIWGAHRADMRTAWIRRGRGWPPDLPGACADLIVDDIAALAHLLPTLSP